MAISWKSRTTTKSPLKSKPLRNPGESLDRELDRILFDEVLSFYLFAALFVVLAVLEWYRWLADASPTPIAYTVVALAAVVLTIWKFWRVKPRIAALKLGRDGEKAVGQYLDRLLAAGAEVFHDVPGEGFNIDHVLIDTTGVYVIETKTLSKPLRGDAKLFFDGMTVRKGNFIPDRNAVTQARAARDWVAELLKESTGKPVTTKAVVLYPGWYVEKSESARSSDVWVLNPKALPTYIKNRRSIISSEDMHLFASHLRRYIRSCAK